MACKCEKLANDQSPHPLSVKDALNKSEQLLFGNTKPRHWQDLKRAIEHQMEKDQHIIEKLACRNIELYSMISSMEDGKDEERKKDNYCGHQMCSEKRRDAPKDKKNKNNNRRSDTLTPVVRYPNASVIDTQGECILHNKPYKKCKTCVPASLQNFASFVDVIYLNVITATCSIRNLTWTILF